MTLLYGHAMEYLYREFTMTFSSGAAFEMSLSRFTESTWCQSILLCEYLGSSWPSGCHSSVLMTGQCKHRNTPKYTTRHLPTEIHTQLNTYGVSGCSSGYALFLMNIGGTKAGYFSRFLMHSRGYRLPS